jgi:hypothetical protein
MIKTAKDKTDGRDNNIFHSKNVVLAQNAFALQLNRLTD